MSQAQLHVSMAPDDWLADDERELVERAKHDREAFAALYRRHNRLLLDYVYRRIGDRHAAEDLVADVFVTALRTLQRFCYRGVPVRFWLLRIATNAVNRWARRNRRRPVTSLQAEHADLPDANQPSAFGDVDLERAQQALLTLSPKHQSVLALHYFEHLSVIEVATTLGCRVGTVKSRLARARDALRNELTQRR